jgi:hypothetical protein
MKRGMGVWLAVAVTVAIGCGEGEAGTGTSAATDDPAGSSSTDPSTSATTATTTTTDPSTDPSTSTTDDPDPSTSSSDDGPTSVDSSSSDSTGAEAVPEGCFDYVAFEPTPGVSLRADVMPIFVESCWMCHQNPNDGIFLGYGGNSDAEATAVRDNLLTETPHQAPNEIFVIPGDPLNSWMMAKVEYDNPGGDCPLIDCPNPGCDWFAPPSEILPTAQLDILRSWIANGAPDN